MSWQVGYAVLESRSRKEESGYGTMGKDLKKRGKNLDYQKIAQGVLCQQKRENAN